MPGASVSARLVTSLITRRASSSAATVRSTLPEATDTQPGVVPTALLAYFPGRAGTASRTQESKRVSKEEAPTASRRRGASKMNRWLPFVSTITRY